MKTTLQNLLRPVTHKALCRSLLLALAAVALPGCAATSPSKPAGLATYQLSPSGPVFQMDAEKDHPVRIAFVTVSF